jgi:CRP-like cAMP-binding protein
MRDRLAAVPPHEGASEDTRPSVCLLDVDDVLAAAIPHDDTAAARRMLQLRTLRLTTGPWTPPAGIGRVLALSVLDGLIVREQVANGHVSLLGPGDLADVRALATGAERWRVVRRTTVAVVDARLLIAGRQWPRLFAALTHRLFDLAAEQTTLNGMLSMPRVDSRLMELFEHYADRWGRATPGGRVLDLPLTHEMLGRLVAARRPTVSLALATLVEQGKVHRDETGAWVLPATAEGAPPADPELDDAALSLVASA